jgi:hypothetical protein
MPTLPPAHYVLEALQLAAVPSALAAAAVFAVILLAGGNRWAAPGAALALAAGAAIGNWYQPSLPWLSEKPDWQWLSVLGDQLTVPAPVWKPDGPAWHWLLWMGLAALAVGLLTRLPYVPGVVRWLVRAAAAGLAAWLLVPADLREETAWYVAAFAAAVFVEWALLEHLCKRSPGGGIPLGLALTFFAAAAVLIHAHTALFTNVATFLGASLGGIAVAARRRADAGGAAPGVAVLLPGLLLTGQTTTFSEVPLTSFLLVALAPLALLPTLVPPLGRWQGIRLKLLQFILILATLVVAVVLAMRAESLEFE